MRTSRHGWVLAIIATLTVVADPDPVSEAVGFQEEIRLADQIIIEKRLERVRKEKGGEREQEALERCLKHLEEDKPLLTLDLSDNDLAELSGFRFLSLKPVLIVLNVGEDALSSDATVAHSAAIEELGLTVFAISAALEEEISELKTELNLKERKTPLNSEEASKLSMLFSQHSQTSSPNSSG